MYFNKQDGMIWAREYTRLGVENRREDYDKPVSEFTEGLISDLGIKEVRAIYPMIKAINTGKLTKNFTLYPMQSLVGQNRSEGRTGYASFILPYGKPVITEHRLQTQQGFFGPGERADVPMGRLVAASMVRRKADEVLTPAKKGYPGTLEGTGYMATVAAVTSPEAIDRILGKAYHTVSIGTRVEDVWESISGKNIADMKRKGEELPAYERGQMYNGQCSYWTMGPVQGKELSYVNAPSDEDAGTMNANLGEDGIKLLVADKKVGKNNEFTFYDAQTLKKYEWNYEESVIDHSHFMDSSAVGQRTWILNGKEMIAEGIFSESVDIIVGSMVEWGSTAKGKINSIHVEGIVPGIPVTLEATDVVPIAKIQIYKDDKPTDRYVGHKLSSLKLSGELKK